MEKDIKEKDMIYLEKKFLRLNMEKDMSKNMMI